MSVLSCHLLLCRPPGNFFRCDIVMGGGDTSRRRSKQATAITVNNNIYDLRKSCLNYRFVCDLCMPSFLYTGI